MAKNILTERLQSYRDQEGPRGQSRDMRDINKWSDRAERNSEIAPRAKGGEMRLHDTSAPAGVPWSGSAGNKMREAKADKNDVGSSFMKQVRRTT